MAESSCAFDNTLVMVALDSLCRTSCPPDFPWLCSLCSHLGMHLVAVRGGSDQQRRSALQAGLSCLPPQAPAASGSGSHTGQRRGGTQNRRRRAVTLQTQPHRRDMAPASSSCYVPPRVISTPVRSGQQVFHTGDLVLARSVSQGAEVLASGSIYAYGPLRGRALAGVCGNAQARIYCACFEAELVSVDGHYRIITHDDLRLWKKAVQVQLNGQDLSVQPL